MTSLMKRNRDFKLRNHHHIISKPISEKEFIRSTKCSGTGTGTSINLASLKVKRFSISHSLYNRKHNVTTT